MLFVALRWGLAVFAIYYLCTDPTGAAHFVHSSLDGLQSAGHSLSEFASNL